MEETRVRRQQSSTVADTIHTILDVRDVGEGDCRPGEATGLLPFTVAEKGGGVQKRKKRSGPSLSFWKSCLKKTQSWKWRPKFLLYWLTSQGFLVLLFGVMWFCITIGTNTSGDVDVATKSPGNQNGTDNNTTMPDNDTSSTAESQVCMIGIDPYDFWTATQFSFETQLGRKISSGKREVSVDCRGLSILVIIQSILGYLLNIFLLGVVFGKDGSGTEFLLTDVNKIVKGLKNNLKALKGVPDKLHNIQGTLSDASQRDNEVQNMLKEIRKLLATEEGTSTLTVLQQSIATMISVQSKMEEQGKQDWQVIQWSLDRLKSDAKKLNGLHDMLEKAQKESSGKNAVTQSRLLEMDEQLLNLDKTVQHVMTNLNQTTGMVQGLLRSSNPIEVDEVEELHED